MWRHVFCFRIAARIWTSECESHFVIRVRIKVSSCTKSKEKDILEVALCAKHWVSVMFAKDALFKQACPLTYGYRSKVLSVELVRYHNLLSCCFSSFLCSLDSFSSFYFTFKNFLGPHGSAGKGVSSWLRCSTVQAASCVVCLYRDRNQR